VLGLDLRGHGRTSLPTPLWGYTSWRRHADDVAALLEKHCSAPVTLAGHSLGATAALLLAGRRPDLIASLALIEPVIQDEIFYTALQVLGATTILRLLFPLARAARGRRGAFRNRKSAVRAFSGRGVFTVFTREMIMDYVADGLLEDGRGRFKLACAPAYEAATFAAQRHDPWAALRRASRPLVLLRAERGSTVSSPAFRRIAAMRPDARMAIVEDAGHMLPMERPDRVRAAIESAVLMGRRGGVDN
jgi:pimeloyl-ACP methyl ester carboxylesterase